jgi:hypothetical protein
MSQYLRLVIDFIAAVLSCYVLASLFHTQFVLYELSKLDVVIDFKTRLSTSAEDLVGLFPAYGSAIALALLLAFLVVKLINKLSPLKSAMLYPLAGALAIFTALMAMQPILNITLIAGAREPLGIAMQCIAGLFGGWVFMHQRHKAAVSENVAQSL